MKFLGIDLGWKSQPSGLCYLQLIDEKLQILDLDRKEFIADILTWIGTCVTPEESATIAVLHPLSSPTLLGVAYPTNSPTNTLANITLDATQPT